MSYTIITRAATGVVEKVHHREPVRLRPELENDWMNPDMVEPKDIYHLLNQRPDDDYITYPVSKAVNVPRNDSEELIKPINSQK